MAEDAEWDAACVAVTDAAERESKRQKLLTAALQKQATAKKARKVKNGGSGGRPKGAAKEEKDRLAESISRLQRDLMPGDIEPEAGPSDGALRVAAAANPTDHVDGPRTAAAALQAGAAHAHASAASRQAAVAAVASTAAVGEFDGDSDDEDHDEPRGTDALAPGGEDARGAGAAPAAARAPAAAAAPAARAPAQRAKRKSPGKLTLNAAQQSEIDRCVQQVKDGTAEDFEFRPPRASMQRAFSALAFTLLSVIVWLPQRLFSVRGVPREPPCPVHGFVGNAVTQHGMVRPRFYADLFLSGSGWLVGSLHSCRLCREKRTALKAAGDPKYKDTHHYFRSYNEGVLEQ